MAYLDLRPEWSTYRRWSGGASTALVVIVAVVVIGVVISWGEPHMLVTVGGMLALVLLVALPVLAHVVIMMKTSALTLDPAQIVHRCYGRTTRLRLGDGVGGLYAPYVTPNGNGGSQTVDQLILVGAGGRPRIRLNGGYWSRQDLEAVAEATGATVDRIPRSASEWERDLPGSMGFAARRPVATAFLIVFVLFALIAGAIAVGVLLSG